MKTRTNSFRTKLCLFVLVLVSQAGLHFVLGQPSLGIAPTGNQSILFWTNTNGTNGVLQSTISLTSPNWVSATDAVPFNYGSNTAVTVTGTASVRFFRLSLVPPTSDGMALIPAGSFTIGNNLDEGSGAIPTNVYVSAFYMDTNLVSYSQWLAIYNWATNNGYGFIVPGSGKAANNPLWIDWVDAVLWCNARSEMAGLTPCYYTNASLTTVYRSGILRLSNSCVNWAANGYRLPTEAEWEKAARGGLSGQRFPWGNTISESQANYYSTNSYSYDLGPYGYNTLALAGSISPTNTPYTTPVGSFAPNGYGLYDMAGNLAEWCWDQYWPPPYSVGSPYLGGTDPRGPSSSWPALDYARVNRGGWWGTYAYGVGCAARFYDPGRNLDIFGFRCVRGP
jgi:formylglycine-generating enzyme required for sulfatase activity